MFHSNTTLNNTGSYKSINFCSVTAKKHRKIVMVDWDDTLFPTHAWMEERPQASAEELREFGRSLYILLNKYIEIFGVKNLFIVTNATQKWVFKSLMDCSAIYRHKTKHDEKLQNADYFAAIYNSFDSMNILVCSARDLHGMFCQKITWHCLFPEHNTHHFFAYFQLENTRNNM